MSTSIGAATQLALLGYGNWGPRLGRNFSEHSGVAVRWVIDTSEARLALARQRIPQVRTSTRVEDALADPEVQGVYIATPIGTHFELVTRALEAGKDVLVEKPLTDTVESAAACVETAARTGRILMVGHTFVYSPPVRMLKEMAAQGALGKLLYMESSRVNLGLFQKDASVLWDLAPHDLSILLLVSGAKPVAVSAHGRPFYGVSRFEDVASIAVEMDSGMVAYLRVSWLAPAKFRRTLLVGDKRMVEYDDLDPNQKLRVYDRGVVKEPSPSYGEFQLTYRVGEIVSPVVSSAEPLAAEAAAFLEAIRTRRPPESDGAMGLEVVKILAAAHESIRQRGTAVSLQGA